MTQEKFVSERGIELFCHCIGDKPVLTLENCQKWYYLYVIQATGAVCVLDWDDKHEEAFVSKYGESAYLDHAYNPKFVMYLAAVYGLETDSTALEVLIGRWAIEYHGFPTSITL